MSQRSIKLRYWDKDRQVFIPMISLALPHENCVVLQFTGVYDCKGVEIWEGDILYWRTYDDRENRVYEGWFEVVFLNGGFGMLNTSGDDFDPFTNLNVSNDRVVGNVFENEDILRKCRAEHIQKAQGD